MKYFIPYTQILKNKIDVNEDKIVIAKKNDKEEYSFIPIYAFGNLKKNVLDNFKTIEKNKNVEFMLEIDEKDKNKYNILNTKKFRRNSRNKYILIKNDLINLINFNELNNMSIDELNKGKIVIVKNDKKGLKIDTENNIINMKESINELRLNLKNNNIVNDIYFYTDDEDLLLKYKDNITSLKEKDNDRYEVIKHKIFIIDSISIDRIRDIDYKSYNLLEQLCFNSIQVYYGSDYNDKYEVQLKKDNEYQKKGYLITRSNLNSIFYNSSLTSLFKYINVFVLVDGYYTKISIEEYLKDKNILKYIKKKS